MKKRTIKECDVKGKRVLLRVDFNVPVDENGEIIDDTKIQMSLETIKYLLEEKAKVIITSHLGRPAGRIVDTLSLRPVCDRLQELINTKVQFADALISRDTEEMIEEMLPGEAIMLENTRFELDEERNSSSLAKKLASFADIYVNDAFASSHRKHASVVGVAKYLETYAGFCMEEEVEKLSSLFERIEKPLTIVLGGAKIDTKIGIIKNFVEKADTFLLGGGLANTFLYAMGYDIGESYAEKDKVKMAKEIIKVITDNDKKILLPIDVIVSDEIKEDAETAAVPLRFLHPKLKILDIGPKTIAMYQEILDNSTTIVWNGPLGVIEYEPFLRGTESIANFIAGKYSNTVVGGGDTLEALKKLHISTSRFTHLSTGGGAMLEFLQNGTLPGIEVIPKVWGV